MRASRAHRKSAKKGLLRLPRRLLAGSVRGAAAGADVLVWGIPSDLGGGSDRLGARAGPRAIREASHIWHSVRTSQGYPFPRFGTVVDVGDLIVRGCTQRDVHDRVLEAAPACDERRLVCLLGGDHSVTYPAIKATGRQWGLIYFDAHPDALDEFDGDRLSHACTLRRIVEDGCVHAGRCVLIGLRAPEAEELEFLQAHRIGFRTARDIYRTGIEQACAWALETAGGGPLYLSVDMDVLDASCAPGVENPEPGGLSSRELLHACEFFSRHVQACDVVELTGECDPAGITAKTAARTVLDIIGGYIQSRSTTPC